MTDQLGGQSTPVASEAQALALLPPDPFLLVTIEEPNGNRPRIDAPILRPRPARETLLRDAADEYGDVPCLALSWAESLEPMYGDHPGSVWPVTEARRAGAEVLLMGPRGTATVRRMPTRQLWQTCGWADLIDVIGGRSSTDVERDRRLPVNRKERFYTGTVLPMIVAGDRFRSLGRMLELCGLHQVDLSEPAELQFFSEYSFA
jgi:hypothetical protein